MMVIPLGKPQEKKVEVAGVAASRGSLGNSRRTVCSKRMVGTRAVV